MPVEGSVRLAPALPVVHRPESDPVGPYPIGTDQSSSYGVHIEAILAVNNCLSPYPGAGEHSAFGGRPSVSPRGAPSLGQRRRSGGRRWRGGLDPIVTTAEVGAAILWSKNKPCYWLPSKL